MIPSGTRVPVAVKLVVNCYTELCYLTFLRWLYRSLAYVPASRPQLDRRPELFVTSRKQLRPNQQRITLSISGIGTLLVECKSIVKVDLSSLIVCNFE